MEVGFGPGDIMLDGDPAPLRKGAQQLSLFGPCLMWPNGHPSQQLQLLLNYNSLLETYADDYDYNDDRPNNNDEGVNDVCKCL